MTGRATKGITSAGLSLSLGLLLHPGLIQAANSAPAQDWGYETTTPTPGQASTQNAKPTQGKAKGSQPKNPTRTSRPARNPASGFGTAPVRTEPAGQPGDSSAPADAGSAGGVTELMAVPAGSLDDIVKKEGPLKAEPLGASSKQKSAPGKAAGNTGGNTGGTAAKARPVAGKGQPVSEPRNTTQAVKDWLALFALAAKQELTDEQRVAITTALQHKLSTERGGEVTDIQQFWPAVQAEIDQTSDKKEAFAAMFKALLRFQSHMKNASADDVKAINETLGPERVAVPGDPQLTEDSIDAYADMTIFLYEQNHPGKTIDAVENRTVMAAVISDKFKDAPTPADKRAVANFAITWTKFKVQWTLADSADRQKLINQITGNKSGPQGKVRNALVDTIFTHGPWK